MSRRHRAEKREINPDPKYNDLVLTKFMNAIMYDGKKSVAEGIVYGAFETIEAKTKTNPRNFFHVIASSFQRTQTCSRQPGYFEMMLMGPQGFEPRTNRL